MRSRGKKYQAARQQVPTRPHKIEEAVPLTQPKWKGQALADGRTITVNLDLAKVPPISGSAAELREVATNLIFNAVDAMPAGGTITLRSGSENGPSKIQCPRRRSPGSE